MVGNEHAEIRKLSCQICRFIQNRVNFARGGFDVKKAPKGQKLTDDSDQTS